MEALRVLREVQRKVTKQFSFVRNAAIAHRDPDALSQFRAIRDLEVAKVANVAVEFYKGVSLFMGVLTRLMNESGTLPALLRQWVQKA